MAAAQRVRTKRLLTEAEGYLELGMPQHALEVLRRIDDPATFRAQWLHLQGLARQQLGQIDRAADLLEQAADLAPSNLGVQLTLAALLRLQGRIGEATQRLVSLMEHSPELASEAALHYMLARLYSLQGDKDRLLWHLNKAVELAPELRERLRDEEDFRPFTGDPDFQALFSIIV